LEKADLVAFRPDDHVFAPARRPYLCSGQTVISLVWRNERIPRPARRRLGEGASLAFWRVYGQPNFCQKYGGGLRRRFSLSQKMSEIYPSLSKEWTDDDVKKS
jgi:hypothetical protein